MNLKFMRWFAANKRHHTALKDVSYLYQGNISLEGQEKEHKSSLLPYLSVFYSALFCLTMPTTPYLDLSGLSADDARMATSKILPSERYNVQS